MSGWVGGWMGERVAENIRYDVFWPSKFLMLGP
jgi:hypothetical protein